MLKILFLCTGNSCRSQMAEGLAREMGKGMIEAHSAGLMPAGVNPNAVRAMAEIGIDISGQRSKGIDSRHFHQMDCIITLCGNAEIMCPATPHGMKRLHWPIDDPVTAVGTDDEVMAAFRAARDDIRQRLVDFIKEAARA